MIDEKALYAGIGKRLRAVRTASSGRHYTQDRLASLVNLERTSISNIEAGNQRVPLHVLYELCNALGVEITEVLPSYDGISEKEIETVTLGGKSYRTSPQIAALVREAGHNYGADK